MLASGRGRCVHCLASLVSTVGLLSNVSGFCFPARGKEGERTTHGGPAGRDCPEASVAAGPAARRRGGVKVMPSLGGGSWPPILESRGAPMTVEESHNKTARPAQKQPLLPAQAECWRGCRSVIRGSRCKGCPTGPDPPAAGRHLCITGFPDPTSHRKIPHSRNNPARRAPSPSPPPRPRHVCPAWLHGRRGIVQGGPAGATLPGRSGRQRRWLSKPDALL
jgi:hypothetical protein